MLDQSAWSITLWGAPEMERLGETEIGCLEAGFRNAASSFDDTQYLGFLNRLTAFADPQLPVDVLQVCFDGY